MPSVKSGTDLPHQTPDRLSLGRTRFRKKFTKQFSTAFSKMPASTSGTRPALASLPSDDFTLEIQLRGPIPFLPEITKHYTWYPVPRHIILKYGKINTAFASQWTKPGNIVSNGPFQLKEWRTNHVLEVEQNPEYWDIDKVGLNGIRYLPISNPYTETRMFGTSSSTSPTPFPPSSSPSLKRTTPRSFARNPTSEFASCAPTSNANPSTTPKSAAPSRWPSTNRPSATKFWARRTNSGLRNRPSLRRIRVPRPHSLRPQGSQETARGIRLQDDLLLPRNHHSNHRQGLRPPRSGSPASDVEKASRHQLPHHPTRVDHLSAKAIRLRFRSLCRRLDR